MKLNWPLRPRWLTHGRRAVAALAALCALAPLGTAAQTGALTAPIWRPPVIALADARAQPVELRAVEVQTEVFAGQARTRVELRLFNPNPRVLEGELRFPLLDGQVVSGFALDVDGALRDAVPVPKVRGREIFEDIRRRGIDPGLLQADAGNQYRLRVYPIPAQGERRVALTLMETLPSHDGQSRLRLPLAWGATVGTLNARVRLPGLPRASLRLLASPVPATLHNDAKGNGSELRLQARGWRATAGSAGTLELALPARPGATAQMLGQTGSQRYFVARLAAPTGSAPRPAPRHIALLWDASGSTAALAARALPALQAYVQQLPPDTRISLWVLRNQAEGPRAFTAGAQGWPALHAALRAEPHDGSTRVDTLELPADVDATLAVTDGLLTDGERRFHLRSTAPLFVLTDGAHADTPRLRALADRHGGALIDVGTPQPAAAQIEALRRQGWRIERLQADGARDLVAARLAVEDGAVHIAGVLTAPRAQIQVHLRGPDGQTRVLPLRVGDGPLQGRWPGQQWAAWQQAQAAADPAPRPDLDALAAEHGLVGPNQSLIVLETAADYARYGLPAPPELQAEVDRLRALRSHDAQAERQAHLDSVARQFEARRRWWATDFPKDTPPPPKVHKNAPAWTVGRSAALGAAPTAAPLERRADAPGAMPVPAAAPAAAAAPAPADAARERTGTGSAMQITLKPWQPDAPYLRRLREAGDDALYAAYLQERPAQADSSAFFLDVAALFFERGQNALGLRVLSNLAEMNLESRQLLRLYGYRLLQAGRSDLALPVFERVRTLAPDEPQSWRDLGLALAEAGQPQAAVDALWQVVARPWSGRFRGVNLIALTELNAIAARAHPALDLSAIDPRLIGALPLDLRVAMAWDSDDTDIDLWVTDPNGERASYANPLTYQGGAMSPDATGGWGPEDFSLRHAKPGRYQVQVQFFGDRQQVLSAGTTVMVRVSTGFGTPAQKDQWLTLRLEKGKQVQDVGSVSVR